jgi:hypothetical protein
MHCRLSHFNTALLIQALKNCKTCFVCFETPTGFLKTDALAQCEFTTMRYASVTRN